MTDQNNRPLSLLVAQGWEIIGFASGIDPSGNHADSVLLRRQKQHKVLKVRKKFFGGGHAVSEIDL